MSDATRELAMFTLGSVLFPGMSFAAAGRHLGVPAGDSLGG